jgi:hypothetical protein
MHFFNRCSGTDPRRDICANVDAAKCRTDLLGANAVLCARKVGRESVR